MYLCIYLDIIIMDSEEQRKLYLYIIIKQWLKTSLINFLETLLVCRIQVVQERGQMDRRGGGKLKELGQTGWKKEVQKGFIAVLPSSLFLYSFITSIVEYILYPGNIYFKILRNFNRSESQKCQAIVNQTKKC